MESRNRGGDQGMKRSLDKRLTNAGNCCGVARRCTHVSQDGAVRCVDEALIGPSQCGLCTDLGNEVNRHLSKETRTNPVVVDLLVSCQDEGITLAS